jgi:pSer/pThr/pTyr-binding forkhead associated (FHA) protein
MSYLASPDAPVLPRIAQPSLRSDDQCCPLGAGIHALGGRAADAVPLVALESQPRAAILTVSHDGVTTLRRTTASVMVRIDGETIGIAPVELHNGARIEFGECRLLFETDASTTPAAASRASERSMSGGTTDGARVLSLSVTGRSGIEVAPQARSRPSVEVATDAALVDVQSGTRHPLRARRIYIGRDDSCDVIVHGNGVSRRHASIAPVAGGFMLRDESTNGTLVNGVRVVGTYLLGNGDVVRVHDAELRVELDASEPAPIVREVKTTQLDLSHITRGVTEQQARAVATRPPTASLEIVRGPFTGACFQVERAVCSIGRGDENDVRIRDDTVSLTHATLLRKGGAWFVVDLRSMNGTFVDGSRVSGERELHPGACVRVGAVELVFRAIDAAPQGPAEPPRRGFWTRLKELLRSVGPPSDRR